MKPTKDLMDKIKSAFKPLERPDFDVSEPLSYSMGGWKGGLSTLADPSELAEVKQKEKDLKEAIDQEIKVRKEDYKLHSSSIYGSGGAGGYPGMGGAGGLSSYGTPIYVAKSKEDKEKAKLMSDMLELYRKECISIYGTPSSPNWFDGIRQKEDTGECTIPGCTVNGKKKKDYGDYICEKHYGVYKENK